MHILTASGKVRGDFKDSVLVWGACVGIGQYKGELFFFVLGGGVDSAGNAAVWRVKGEVIVIDFSELLFSAY